MHVYRRNTLFDASLAAGTRVLIHERDGRVRPYVSDGSDWVSAASVALTAAEVLALAAAGTPLSQGTTVVDPAPPYPVLGQVNGAGVLQPSGLPSSDSVLTPGAAYSARNILINVSNAPYAAISMAGDRYIDSLTAIAWGFVNTSVLSLDLSNSSLKAVKAGSLHACASVSIANCALLTDFELADFTGLETLTMTGCPALERFVFQDCESTGPIHLHSPALTNALFYGSMASLVDLSNCPALAHFTCGGTFASLDLSGATVLNDCNIGFVSTLTTVNVSNCAALTTLDLSGQVSSVVSLNVSGCTSLTTVSGSPIGLPEAMVDSVLDQLDVNGASNGTVNLENSAPPGAAGLLSKAALEAKGWTVIVHA